MSAQIHGVIGIDLGTTYSAVAAYDNYTEQAELLMNTESGNGITTPSVIGLDPATGRVFVGAAAKRNRALDPLNTVIEIKREMGEVFTEASLDKYDARSRCAVGEPVRVPFRSEWYRPQEISALLLMRLKEVAEEAAGRAIHDAVITVPAYFTERQKKATEEAALLAGLYPRQLLPEPTAAAICYGVDRFEPTRRIYVVYDLGGGTFDVSVIAVENTQIDVLATSGDRRLGGSDFDDAIVAWIVQRLKQQHGLNVEEDPLTLRTKLAQLKAHAEQAKKELSMFPTAKMTLLDVWPDRPITLEITRTQLESLIDPFLGKSLRCIDEALEAAERKGVARTAVDAVLLVGGSSKIPRVRQKLGEHFGRDESFIRTDLDPDAVVARGAAIMAKRFAPTQDRFDLSKRPESIAIPLEDADGLQVNLITEHSLGIGIQDDRVQRIVEQGTNLPVACKLGGLTNAEMTDEIIVPVYQGEGATGSENTPIGELRIGPITPAPANAHAFEVTFALDQNGLLTVLVNHLNEGKVYQARFAHETGVGGLDALEPLRSKLVHAYAPDQAATILAAEGSPHAAAPPKMNDAVGASITAVADTPPPAVDPASTSRPGDAERVAAPHAEPQLLTPQREVPAEFKSILRRAQKLALDLGTPELVDAVNRFVSALDRDAPTDELEAFGDELADAYDDARANR